MNKLIVVILLCCAGCGRENSRSLAHSRASITPIDESISPEIRPLINGDIYDAAYDLRRRIKGVDQLIKEQVDSDDTTLFIAQVLAGCVATRPDELGHEYLPLETAFRQACKDGQIRDDLISMREWLQLRRLLRQYPDKVLDSNPPTRENSIDLASLLKRVL